MQKNIRDTHHPKRNIRTVQIQSLNKKGVGIGETETGGRLDVPFTLPGETVLADKIRRNGKLIEVLEPSPYRIDSTCKHFQTCGGCAWQHITLNYQLELKMASVKKHWDAHEIDIQSIPIQKERSSPFHYRNRMDFVWWYDGSFGLRKKGKWHSVVNLEECWLLPTAVMDAALTINQRVQDVELPFRDNKKKVPGLRYLIIRCGIFTNEIMLNIVSDSMSLPDQLWDGIDNVVSVYQLVNDNPESDTSDGEPVHLFGSDGYYEEILGQKFLVKPNVFYQPNPAMAQNMVQTVRTWITQDDVPKKKFVDLYCGVGLFTVLLADLFAHTCGIEVVASSIELARQHAGERAIDFKVADAVEVQADWLRDVDVLLVDPPREGLLPKVIETIQQTLPKRLIYVSCHPHKCVEDMAALLAHYEIKRIAYFDQFPQTPHIEMIVLLALK